MADTYQCPVCEGRRYLREPDDGIKRGLAIDDEGSRWVRLADNVPIVESHDIRPTIGCCDGYAEVGA